MLDYLRGALESKSANSVTIDIDNVGYEVVVALSTLPKLPNIGTQVKIYIVEAVSGMYGGVICLYGFLTKEEREMYLMIKNEVPGTGAKKAMEYMDKISKSFADFKMAVVSKNPSMLHSIFGFTKKTADKLIAALKDTIVNLDVLGQEKWTGVLGKDTIVLEAISGLVALGYKEMQARTVVNRVYEQNKSITLEGLIKRSLQEL